MLATENKQDTFGKFAGKKKKQDLTSTHHATYAGRAWDSVVTGGAEKHPNYCLLETTTIDDVWEPQRI